MILTLLIKNKLFSFITQVMGTRTEIGLFRLRKMSMQIEFHWKKSSNFGEQERGMLEVYGFKWIPVFRVLGAIATKNLIKKAII